MTVPERPQHLRDPIPVQAQPPAIEAIGPGLQLTAPEPLVVRLAGWDGRIFEELVELAQDGNARVLSGYLDQQARTPAASRLELAAQKAVYRRNLGDLQAATEIRCLQAARRARLLRVHYRFLPDDLRPRYMRPALTAAALALIKENPTYASLAMLAREQREEKERKSERTVPATSERPKQRVLAALKALSHPQRRPGASVERAGGKQDDRDFLAELGFLALGWAAKRVAWQRKALW